MDRAHSFIPARGQDDHGPRVGASSSPRGGSASSSASAASLRSSHSAKNRTSPQVMVAKKLSNERRPSQSSLERSVVRKASQQGKHSDKVATPAGKFTSKSNVVYTDPENRVGTRNGRTPKLQPSRDRVVHVTTDSANTSHPQPHETSVVRRRDSKFSILKESMSSARSFALRLNKNPVKTMHRTSASLLPTSIKELEDSYLEDIMLSGEKPYKDKRQGNVRRGMGFWKLWWHDYKVWRRRRKFKKQDIPVFAKQMKKIEGGFGSGVVSFFVFSRWILLLNCLLALLWLAAIAIPMAVVFKYTSITKPFSIRNLLDGGNALSQSWMFFGAYSAYAGFYPLSLGYFTMILITYFGSLYIILQSIACASDSGSEGAQDTRFTYSCFTFGSWDYSLTSKEAVLNLSLGLANSIKDHLSEHKASAAMKNRTRGESYKIIALRCLAWLITIVLIGGGCSLIVMMVVGIDMTALVTGQTAEEGSFIETYGTTIVFSLINMLVPPIVNLLPKFEHYVHGQTELMITITRVFVLRMANLFALIISLRGKINKTSFRGCGGTVIGQELYKLIIVDTIMHAILTLTLSFAKFYWTGIKREFSLSKNVLVAVYRQALIWTGTVACPVLPLIGMLSQLEFFMVNNLIVTKTCKPPTKRWNQSRRNKFFMALLVATLSMLLVPLSLTIGRTDFLNLSMTGISGSSCGPFGNDTIINTVFHFRDDLPGIWRVPFDYLFSGTIIVPALFIMGAVILFQKLRLGQQKKEMDVILTELGQEREDNKDLLCVLHGMGTDTN